MARMLVGYARCSTDAQDLTAQRDALTALGVKPNRIYVDYADQWVMPTLIVKPVAGKAIALDRSA